MQMSRPILAIAVVVASTIAASTGASAQRPTCANFGNREWCQCLVDSGGFLELRGPRLIISGISDQTVDLAIMCMQRKGLPVPISNYRRD